jgi:hypothetical protein
MEHNYTNYMLAAINFIFQTISMLKSLINFRGNFNLKHYYFALILIITTCNQYGYVPFGMN